MKPPFKKGRSRRFQGKYKPRLHGRPVYNIKPGADVRLKKIFARIGAPKKMAFEPDPFQIKAVAAIRSSDCLVSAPTGSGKTWIAQQAIGRILGHGGRAWYASPLKALTNAKLIEFAEAFGADNVGILTGDRKENADAPVIVGTTEILRNQLYDAMHEGADLSTDLVVLDEAHFLGDEDRGVVWEETMIYLPHRVHLLLLSATIKNAQQVSGWLESIRDKRCRVIEEYQRPVPLFPLFFHPSGKLLPLLDAKGLDRKVKKYMHSPHPPVVAPPTQLPPFAEILQVLRRYDLLPAIFFMKSRADCDASLDRCLDGAGLDTKRKAMLYDRTLALTATHPHLAEHRQILHLKQEAVAAHHAGQLPAWKLVVETLMTEGLLDAVFATSTVAAGVNFPARSVVFLNSDRYNGHEFIPLDATEFHQATGRAGRRGKDRIGFAIVMPGPYMDVRLIGRLFNARPEAVVSQIRVDFPMVLNLLLSHTPEEIEGIFQRSLATYLNVVSQRPGLERILKQSGRRLVGFVPGRRCSGPEALLDLTRRRKALIRDVSVLKRQYNALKSRLVKMAYLQPGRLFLDSRGRAYCVLKLQAKREVQGVLASRVKIKRRGRSRNPSMRWFRPQRVATMLDRVLTLPTLEDRAAVSDLLESAAQQGDFRPLELSLGDQENAQLQPHRKRLAHLEEELGGLVCNTCKHLKRCHGKSRGAFGRARDTFALAWDSAHAVRMRLWKGFMKHLEFLREEGFVTAENTLTEDGMWASKLRLDQPLMIAEGLRKGIFPENDPLLLAALVAPFVHDRDVEEILDTSKISKQLLQSFEKMKTALHALAERMAVRGFEVRPITLWTSATLFSWAKGASWEQVVRVSGMAEGDLSMLILRTAENLRQLASLSREYPAIAASASLAIDILLREPVAIA
jgi:superfamily II RNA helicase